MASTSVAEIPPETKRPETGTPPPAPDPQALPVLQVSMTGNPVKGRLRLDNPAIAFALFHELTKADREHFYVLHLDSRNRLIAKELIAIGSASACLAHPREVFKGAVINGSNKIVCVHNHPGGDPKPSDEDKALTDRLKQAGDLLGIPLADHIIIGDSLYFSFADSGLMPVQKPTVADAAKEKEKWLTENNYLKIQSNETANGNDLETELELILQRLALVENLFFDFRDGQKLLDRLDDRGFEGLGLLIREASTGVYLLNRALFGEE